VTQILAQALDQQRGLFHLTHDRVATPAQQAAYASGGVAVINDEIPTGGVAEKAATTLGLPHLFQVLGGQAVLPHEAGAQVFLPSGFRVRSAPCAQTFVPASFVCLSVLAVAAGRACAALPAFKTPLGELRVGQVLGAEAACRHQEIMSRDTNTQPLDQPCHADVLLEIANQGEGGTDE
jgi:hypothetical protein